MKRQQEITLFKICYRWCEGEYRETLLGKNVIPEEFEKDITEAKKFAQSLLGRKIQHGSYLGKGYSVECLPEYYSQIIWFLIEKKRYVECSRDEHIEYYIDDGTTANPIAIEKSIRKVEWQKIHNSARKKR